MLNRVQCITPQQLGKPVRVSNDSVIGSSSFGVGNPTQKRKLVHKTRQNCLTQNFATDSETLNRCEISE